MPRTEKELIERDAKRNIGEELLASIQGVKAGRHTVTLQSEAVKARGTR